MVNFDQWNGFKGRLWKEEINVRDFVQNNYKPYDGDESFLEGPARNGCKPAGWLVSPHLAILAGWAAGRGK